MPGLFRPAIAFDSCVLGSKVSKVCAATPVSICFIFNFVYVSVCRYMLMSAGAQGGQKRAC